MIHLLVGLLHEDSSGFKVLLPCEASLSIGADKESRSDLVFLPFHITILTNRSLFIL